MDLRLSSARGVRSLIESDHESKPSVSLENTPQRSSDMVSKEDQLPLHLKNLVEEWCAQNGDKLLPCAHRNKRTTRPSKIFDREGNELRFEYMYLPSPCSYYVVVIYPVNSPAKLVAPMFPYGIGSRSFLRGWLGMKDGYEEDCCAYREAGEIEDAIFYNPESWSKLEELLGRDRDNKTNSPRTSTPVSTRQRIRPSTQNPMLKRTLAGGTQRPRRGVSERNQGSNKISPRSENEETSSDEDSSSETGSSSGSEEEDEEPAIPTRTAKKIKVERPDSDSHSTHNLVFKLVSFKSGAARRFPLEECRTGKELFEKARLFYKLFDKNVDVKVLTCQISSEREQHYLFDGNEGEFKLLIDYVKEMNIKSGEPLTIEIGHVIQP